MIDISTRLERKLREKAFPKYPKYKTMLERGSKVTLRTSWKNLTFNEKVYIQQGIDRMIGNDYSQGGYGGKFKRYILKGGRLPKPTK